MKTFSALLALCEGKPPVFPSQSPVTWSFDVFFDLRLNKRLGKQSRRRWFETPSRSLWRHYRDETQQNTTQQSATGCKLWWMICNLRHGIWSLETFIDTLSILSAMCKFSQSVIMERVNLYIFICYVYTNKDQQFRHLGGLSTISLHHEIYSPVDIRCTNLDHEYTQINIGIHKRVYWLAIRSIANPLKTTRPTGVCCVLPGTRVMSWTCLLQEKWCWIPGSGIHNAM